MRGVILTLVLAAIFRSQVSLAEAPSAQWIVVSAPALRSELDPLIARRRAQNYKVIVIETTNVLSAGQIQAGDGAPLQARLKDLAAQFTGPSFVLLAGNVLAGSAANALQIVVPARPGATGRMRGKPSDYGYSLPAANGEPRIAVGRFPARNAADLRAMVAKTLRIEDDTRPGAWRNRLFLFMGDSGGGLLADMLVEPALSAGLAQLHPAWTLRGESATASRFQTPAPLLRETILQSLGQGNLFSVFLCHSSAGAIWLTGTNWLERSDFAQLQVPRGGGILFSCGCFASQWRGPDGVGYGQVAMRNPAGPVAVMAATDESYSVAGALALHGLTARLERPPFPLLLGQYWLSVEAGLAEDPIDPATFAMLDRIDGSGGKIPLAIQRREDLEMWQLFGDPALRLPMVPLAVTLKCPEAVEAGGLIRIDGSVEGSLTGAAVHLTLERPLNELPAPEAKTVNPTEKSIRANNFVLTEADAKLIETRFSCSMTAPTTLPWSNLVVRAIAATSEESAQGVVTIPVRQQPGHH